VPAEAKRKLLAHAAVRAGGVTALAAKLDVSQYLISRCIRGDERVPDALFLQIVDLLLEEASPPPTLSEPEPKRDP
jgi:hypothetical protein